MLLQTKGSFTIVPPRIARSVEFGEGYIRFKPSWWDACMCDGVMVLVLTPTPHLCTTKIAQGWPKS